jgi:hypothetical protein
MSVGRLTPGTAFDAARGHVEELRTWAERDNIGKVVANRALLEGLQTLRSLAKINYPFTLSGAGCNSTHHGTSPA